ncbi:Small-conductance mechanosensitive channel [Microlunatus sagamiharensis]|uniref:Small-conductance mechanosensitive channel n=1 Tax=Microlunatus sagamiharensis TaxID=546874 RepID=A0A1H2LK16_9ACTN|nr:mechanosensitive ion channel domain-containing protein [Microlunatus sagamiharensis]SDU81357.1 Small-conductance mechanosensitive channel [Microlunatus sagamiharensis]
MAVTFTDFALTLLLALLVTLVGVVVVHVVATLLARRWPLVGFLSRSTATAFRLLAVVLVIAVVVRTSRPQQVPPNIWEGVELVLRLASIGAVAWFVGALLLYFEDLGLQRYRTDVSDNRNARRLRTQVLVIRRLTVALVVLIALGAALLSFPGVRAVGASLLASAGLLSVVGAVAAQSTLANVFAGIQLAFSDAIRIDDVVVVDQQWGRIEELTLSYVVVHLWDDRRLVLPSGYFTKEPYENWTRRTSELVGAVELDLDWRVDVDGLRTRLDEILATTALWDGRSSSLAVTDATGGFVRVRVLVSATDASTLFDLRCRVREGLVAWARDHAEAGGLPRQRVELVAPAPRAEVEPPASLVTPS